MKKEDKKRRSKRDFEKWNGRGKKNKRRKSKG